MDDVEDIELDVAVIAESLNNHLSRLRQREGIVNAMSQFFLVVSDRHPNRPSLIDGFDNDGEVGRCQHVVFLELRYSGHVILPAQLLERQLVTCDVQVP